MGPFIHVTIRRDRHHQNISQTPGLLEIADMSDMQQIKDPVTVNDLLILSP
jgi:hypothetical protein